MRKPHKTAFIGRHGARHHADARQECTHLVVGHGGKLATLQYHVHVTAQNAARTRDLLGGLLAVTRDHDYLHTRAAQVRHRTRSFPPQAVLQEHKADQHQRPERARRIRGLRAALAAIRQCHHTLALARGLLRKCAQGGGICLHLSPLCVQYPFDVRQNALRRTLDVHSAAQHCRGILALTFKGQPPRGRLGRRQGARIGQGTFIERTIGRVAAQSAHAPRARILLSLGGGIAKACAAVQPRKRTVPRQGQPQHLTRAELQRGGAHFAVRQRARFVGKKNIHTARSLNARRLSDKHVVAHHTLDV